METCQYTNESTQIIIEKNSLTITMSKFGARWSGNTRLRTSSSVKPFKVFGEVTLRGFLRRDSFLDMSLEKIAF